MKIEFELEVESDDTGPWLELWMVAGDRRLSVLSEPINPRNNETVDDVAFRAVTDLIARALRSAETLV